MAQRQIVIASVLKPVLDTRLFEKLGLSLAQKNKYEVNIIGFWSKKIPTIPSVRFHPIFTFKRNSLKRLAASWKYYKLLIKVKPELIIVSTPELLLVSVLYKILFGTKLCYDVQENYYRNIRYTPTYPRAIKTVLASFVKLLEDGAERWIDLYLLAEECYTYERNFPEHKSAVILNKFRPLKPVKLAKPLAELPHIRFLYTGTIAENYGIFKAIELTKNISKIYPNVSLTIIGYSADEALIHKVSDSIVNAPFIYLKTDSKPIPHEEIVAFMSKADFAILPYQPDKSIENCFPTKIWEYMAHGLPMIIQSHKRWADYCQKHESCIAINFNQYDPHQIIESILTQKFYPFGPPNDVFWHSEELTLIKAIEKVLTIK